MAEKWKENVIKEKVKILVLHPVSQDTEGDSLVDPLVTHCKNEENKEELEQKEEDANIVNQDISVTSSTKKQEKIDTVADLSERIKSNQDSSTTNLMKSQSQSEEKIETQNDERLLEFIQKNQGIFEIKSRLRHSAKMRSSSPKNQEHSNAACALTKKEKQGHRRLLISGGSIFEKVQVEAIRNPNFPSYMPKIIVLKSKIKESARMENVEISPDNEKQFPSKIKSERKIEVHSSQNDGKILDSSLENQGTMKPSQKFVSQSISISSTNENSPRVMECPYFICDARFSSTNTYKKHIVNFHEGKNPLKCETCKMTETIKKGFKGEECENCLFEHCTTIHDGIKQGKIQMNNFASLACPYCEIRFIEQRYLDDHIKVFHEKKVNGVKKQDSKKQCSICKAVLPSMQAYKKHKISVHGMSCNICKMKFLDKSNVQWHIEKVHGIYKKCCTIEFTRKTEWKNHLLSVHEGKNPKKCDFCDDAFLYRRDRNKHTTSVHKENTFACKICSIVFLKEDTLKSHILSTHEGIKPHKCGTCDKRFSKKTSIRLHMKRFHSDQNPHKCAICNESFRLSRGLTKHMRFKHKIEKFGLPLVNLKCHFCKESFAKRNRFVEHVNKLHKETAFGCDICDVVFTSIENLLTHTSTVHERSKPYKCKECDKRFAVEISISIHMKQCHGDHRCTICKESFSAALDLKKHIRLTHKPNQQRKCTFCGESFRLVQELRRHIGTTHKTISCKFCDEKFLKSTYEMEIKTHLDTVHEGKKPLKCELCSSEFVLKSLLSVHIKNIHSTVKTPFKCSKCNEAFRIQNEMKMHVALVHEGKKLFQCKLCDSKYTNKKSLAYHHDLTHEKKYNSTCEICKTTLKTKTSLISHISVMHKGEKLLKCTLCSSLFLDDISLEEHVRIHHESRYKCTNCDSTFKRKANLRLHIRFKHKSENENCSESKNGSIQNEKKVMKTIDIRDGQNSNPILRQTVEMDPLQIESDIENIENFKEKIQEDEKHYKSKSCDLSFTHKQKLDVHISILHERKMPFQCKKCNASFISKISLNEHISIVHKVEKPFKCEICSNSYVKLQSLERHHENIHNVQVLTAHMKSMIQNTM